MLTSTGRWRSSWASLRVHLLTRPATRAKLSPFPPFPRFGKPFGSISQKQADFQPGDLITREQVEPLLGAASSGWDCRSTDAKQILDKLPAKGEFLVEQFSTPSGRNLMRRVASAPNVYDRLDRLSRMPQGHQTIQGMINSPGGEKMIDYMTKSPAGPGIGKILSSGQQAEQFGTPTGRIYTVDDLLTRLQQSYAAASKASSSPSLEMTPTLAACQPLGKRMGGTL